METTTLAQPVSKPVAHAEPARALFSSSPAQAEVSGRVSRPFTIFHPGWLFIIAGIGIIACTMLIPAQLDLADARFSRELARDAENHREARLKNYRTYLTALEDGQPALVMSLAASQLNQIPADRSPIPGMTEVSRADASVFAALEPQPMVEPQRRKVDSMLVRLTTNDTLRLWLAAGGIVSLMLGLLPASRARGEVPERE